MKSKAKLLALLFAMIVLDGCTRHVSAPVPLDVALRGVETDLKNSAVVNMPDLLSGDPARETAFKEAIKNAQCFYRKANPIVPVLVKDFSLALQGTFNATGGFAVSGAPTGPGMGVGLDVAKTLGQTLTIPISFVSIATLPDVYLQQSLSYLNGMPEADKIQYITRVRLYDSRDDMKKKIEKLIAEFPTVQCLEKPEPPPARINRVLEMSH